MQQHIAYSQGTAAPSCLLIRILFVQP